MHITYQRQRTRNAFVFQWGNTMVPFTITTYVMLINTTLVPAHDFAGSKSSVVKYTKTEGLKNYILKTLYK